MTRILILGGTGGAVDLARCLIAAGFDVTTSLAGVTTHPVMPAGGLRVGGFGGADGLRRYVNQTGIAAIADATHPFAARMSRHAAEAGVPVFRLERPAWPVEPGWTVTASVAAAVAALPSEARALVTIGRKEAGLFFARSDMSGVARMIEAVEAPATWTIIAARPPFTLEAEVELMRHHAITHLVSKNSGSPETAAKLMAAHQLQMPVIMVARPTKPPVPTVPTPAELMALLRRSVSP